MFEVVRIITPSKNNLPCKHWHLAFARQMVPSPSLRRGGQQLIGKGQRGAGTQHWEHKFACTLPRHPARLQQHSNSSDERDGGNDHSSSAPSSFFKQFRQQQQQAQHGDTGSKEADEFKQRIKESLRATQSASHSSSSSFEQASSSQHSSHHQHHSRQHQQTVGSLLSHVGQHVRKHALSAQRVTGRVFSPVTRRLAPYMPYSVVSATSSVRDAFSEEVRLLFMPPAQAAEYRNVRRRAKQQGQEQAQPNQSSTEAASHSSNHAEEAEKTEPANSGEASGSGAVMVVAQPKEPFWKRHARRVSEMPGVRRVSRILGGAAVRGRSAADDVYEKLENSDNRVAHKVLDSYDYLRTAAVEENTHAACLRMIKEREEDFSVDASLGFFQREMPKVLEAYLAGDHKGLERSIVSKEMLERLGGEAKHWLSQGYKMDSQVLAVSDVELVEAKRVDNEPCLVVKFIAQQINCMRDLAGTVVEGAPDDIRAVHYVCAMEHTLTPREHRERPAWQLRELAIQGMEQLTS